MLYPMDNNADAINGFGMHSGEQMEMLQKALSTGTPGSPAAVPGSADTSAGALRVESLESTLKTTTFRMEHIKFWRAIAKKRAFSTVEEYNLLTSYGSEASAFFDEGGLPREEDATYERKFQVVKFLGVTKVVTQPLLMVRSAHGDVMARETINGTMWILERLEKSLFFANSINNSLQFNGIAAQIIPANAQDTVQGQTTGAASIKNMYAGDGTTQNIIDLRGNPLTEEALEQAAQVVADFYGRMQCLFLGTSALSDLAKTFYPKERIHLPAPTDGVVGTPLTHFASQNGYVRLEPNVFIRPTGGIPATFAVSPGQVAGLATLSVAGTSLFRAGEAFDYKVSAVDKAGNEGQASATVAGIVVGTGDYMRLRWDRIAAVTSYRIYRAATGSTDFKLMVEVPEINTAIGAGPGQDLRIEFQDNNRWLPGTGMAFGLYMDAEQGLAFKQLAPLMKVNLATLSAAIRFMILLYGVPEVYSPSKQIVFVNIGRLSV